MWDLNYNDLCSLYGFGGGTYSTYAVTDAFETLRSLLDGWNDTTSVPKRNRAESRKHIREIHRRNVISIRINSLLGGVPIEGRYSFTREELLELHRMQHNMASYDYWPISKSVTRRLRGLVKKQNGRRIIVSLQDFLMLAPHTLLNTAEI